MNSQIKLYRVILNVLFYIFYVLIVSISFSFLFPTLLIVLWQEVLDPSNTIFDSIQIAIALILLVFSLIFRKYFYLPIRTNIVISKSEIKKEIKEEVKKEIKRENIVDKEIDSFPPLDIKVGKEIK
jgi:hypothetical protein